MLSDHIKSVHCIGVGGIGVSALAEILCHQGFQVSGSDCQLSSLTKRLVTLGVEIFDQHAAEHVYNADLIIYSSAIAADNVELQCALERGIPCYKRGQVLAELFNAKKGIAIVGSHGKTTTTSMVSSLLVDAGLDPTYVIGGILQGENSPVRFGHGEYFVAEGDESDGSFLLLKPKVAIVTNIDQDHLSYYGDSYSSLLNAFVLFLNSLTADGLAILNMDDPGVQSILPQLNCNVMTFGVCSSADVLLLNPEQKGMLSQFVCQRQNVTTRLQINLPGQHNMMNAMAACALSYYLSISSDQLIGALKKFAGVGRRFQCRGKIALDGGEICLIEDYGHHPHAISVTLQAIRQAWSHRRLILVFQPHRYSRTKELLHKFSSVISRADFVILLDVYAAGEGEIQGGTTADLLALVDERGHQAVHYLDGLSAVPDFLFSVARPDDIILLQGAGSVGGLAPLIIESFKQGCC